jgi:alpha-glucosidase (family GH31 glycosyl hydrolase)
VDGPLTVTVYPGADGAFTLYEDDGRSFDHRKGEFMRVEMAWRDRDRRLTMALARGSRMRPPVKRPIEVRVAGRDGSKRAVFEGKPLDVRF